MHCMPHRSVVICIRLNLFFVMVLRVERNEETLALLAVAQLCGVRIAS